jgi:hypothetical protein
MNKMKNNYRKGQGNGNNRNNMQAGPERAQKQDDNNDSKE